MQIEATMTLAVFATFFTVMLNMFLSIDLILLVRYPFDKKDGRNKIYLIISFICSVMYTGGIGFINETSNLYYLSQWMGVIMICLFFLVFMFSIVYTCKKLSG